MNTEKPKINGLSHNRFGSIIFFIRMAGVPLQVKKISAIYAVYMKTVNICIFGAFIGEFFDVYVHWDDFRRAMTTIRVLIPITNIMWMYITCK
jgi:hypothetical protein